MPYTLWSSEGLLGESELDFIYRENRLRVGVLDATELGEILLGIAPGTPIGAPHPCDALRLEIRDANGGVIPTEEIWVRDIEYVLSLPDPDEGEYTMTDEEREQLERDIEHDVELFFGSDGPAEHFAPPEADSAPPDEEPRFQLYVRLIDDASIP